MTTHNWQAVDGGFVCAGCGMKSLKGTSRAECKPRGSKRESEPRKPVELTPEEAARMARLSAARNAREHCRHRGEQLTKDGKPWAHPCGCPSSEKVPVFACAIHEACMRLATSPPPGVTTCHHCKDAETADG